MNRKIKVVLIASAALVVLGATKCFAGQEGAPPAKVSPATMPRVATIDERFQSYNIEMVEVTGGRFWKPYDAPADASKATASQQADTTQSDTDPSRYQYRPSIDLTDARLRKLAAAL